MNIWKPPSVGQLSVLVHDGPTCADTLKKLTLPKEAKTAGAGAGGLDFVLRDMLLKT